MKRKFYILSLLLLCALLASLLFACTAIATTNTEKQKEDSVPAAAEEKKTILFLGDSIGEGLAGPDPLTERENYAYYGIIGNINGYDFYDRAVTGYTTADLAAYVKREDDGINRVRSLISTADIIHISIIGNDFLNSNHAQMMIDLADDVYDRVLSRQTVAKANLEDTLTTIRSYNKDAVIILQTLYNPTGEESLLIGSTAQRQLARRGIEPDGYHALMDKMIHAINDILYDYLDEHTTVDDDGNSIAPFELVDVYSAFEKVYEEDNERWQTLICSDDIHPRSEGHAIIAECIQAKLEELRLAAKNALHAYKDLKVRQLNRLYPDLESKSIVRNNIMRATSYAEVRKAYFDGKKGVIPHYAEMPTRDGKHFAEDKTFELSLLRAFDTDLTSYVDLPASEITFKANGEFLLYIPIKELILQLAKVYIGREGVNVGDFYYLDYAPLYFSQIAPGCADRDVIALLNALKDLYGLEIVGLELDSPALNTILERFRETGDLIIDDAEAIGDTLAFKSTGTYVLDTVYGADGTEYTAVYVNNLVGTGESFMRFTYRNDDSGEWVRLTVDVIQLEAEGDIREE